MFTLFLLVTVLVLSSSSNVYATETETCAYDDSLYDAVNGKSGAILEPGLHPVGVHVVAAGKQFRHNSILQDLIFGVRSLEPRKTRARLCSGFSFCLFVR